MKHVESLSDDELEIIFSHATDPTEDIISQLYSQACAMVGMLLDDEWSVPDAINDEIYDVRDMIGHELLKRIRC